MRGEGGRGVGIESTQQRRDQVITLSQQGLTFVENFPDSAMNGLAIDQKPFLPPETKTGPLNEIFLRQSKRPAEKEP